MRRGTLLLVCAALATWPSTALGSSSVNWGPGAAATLPSNATPNSTTSINSVSCSSAGNCGAVGLYVSASLDQGLLLTESGGAWAPGAEAVLPTGASASNPNVIISSVSCPSAGSCTAVGSYYDSSFHTQGLLLSETGGSWSAGAKAPLPVSVSTNPGVALNSVSCSSAGNCIAVGSFYDGLNYKQGLILTESGGTWTAATMLIPSGAPANPLAALTSVSCPSAGNCTAVGDYDDSSHHEQGLMVSESSGNWSQSVEAMLPVGVTGIQAMTSVSCASAGNCAAIGDYSDSSANQQGLLLNQSAGTWARGIEAQLPANAGTTQTVALTSVSCPPVGSCVAVGSYMDGSGNQLGLLLAGTAGAWGTGLEAPLPSSAWPPGSNLYSVSCPSAGNCVAVGDYEDSANRLEGLSLTQSSGTWTTGAAVPLPGDAASSPGVTLSSVSCANAGSCSTVGNYINTSAGSPGLLLTAAPANPGLSVAAPGAGTPGSAIGPSALSATLSSGASPVGTITFTVFGPQPSPPSSCGPGGTSLGGTAVADNGVYHPPAAFTPPGVGDYWWYASYGGDTGDNSAASSCGSSMAETVVRATPALSLTAPAAGSSGSLIAASSVAATLSSVAGSSGTLTFTVFGPRSSPPTSCTAGGTTVGTATPTGNGTYQPSAGFSPIAAGDYWWYASYNGDAEDNPAASSCGASMAETVVAAGGSVSVAAAGSVGHITVVGTTARVPVTCRGVAGQSCNLRLTLTRRRVTLKAASALIGAGRTTVIRLSLGASGRRMLARLHGLAVRLTVAQSGRLIARRMLIFHSPSRHKRRSS